MSPSGELVVFDGAPQSGNRPGDFDVQIERTNGTGRRTVAGTPDREIGGRFSPDGKLISYSREDVSTGASSIWIADLANGRTHRLTRGSDALWSPNGRRLVFSRGSDKSHLYMMNLADRSIRQLTRGPSADSPAGWSPDASAILFTRVGTRSGVYTIDVVGGNLHHLTAAGELATAGAYAPDGKWIAFSKPRRGVNQVFVMRSDGSNIRPVYVGRLDVLPTDWATALR